MRSWFSLVIALFGLGCGSGPRATARSAPPRDPLPAPLIVAGDATVVMSQGPEHTRFAMPRGRLPLMVVGASADGRDLTVRIAGGIEVTGSVARDTTGVLVCEPGPLADHFYAGTGNFLALRPGGDREHVKVKGEVLLHTAPRGETTTALRRLSFEAEIDIQRLCRTPPREKHAGTADDPEVLHAAGEVNEDDFPSGVRTIEIEKGAAVTLLAAPAGPPLYTRPADEWDYYLVHLRRQGEWDLVAAGGGPYLAGWIPARREPAAPPTGGLGLVGDLVGASIPGALDEPKLSRLPLHELRAGTEVRPLGAQGSAGGALLVRPGLARVFSVNAGRAHVLAAVDDDVTVDGSIEVARLGPRVKENGGHRTSAVHAAAVDAEVTPAAL